ncbi:tetratricopeptide repeat protein [Phormidesmis priestleyi ULC007]|uniref:Tetratricopeptide repeat protein n=1 Tax=Phormidesmis priestleyi ULC007 TaxID=1920490 RepID=A0A2T1DBB7_9CYAN|nr:tetratricopeptide repeat protein [Phormidesmis priestleyi]PSB17822.1 tetratricopeptide repeat protein [Phormidesmis priestleyi ULC007]PZO46470.1 MAG: tetratricopeptide repeat protein [Phormidesmis priestleyi]
MNETSINLLLQDLKNSDEAVRDQATEELWRIWFTQKGVAGFQMLQRVQGLLQAGETTPAETILTDLIEAMPDFAEALNRRAVLYFLIGDYQKAIADCQAVIRLNPIHFGAHHGLGLCYAAIGDHHKAIQAFREALKIQPFAIQNQRLILECTAKLS